MVDVMKSVKMSEKVQELRYDKLIEIIKPNELKDQEKSVFKDLCWNYQDIFHLPGDKLTFTNVKKFNLPLLEASKIVNRKHQKNIGARFKSRLKNYKRMI